MRISDWSSDVCSSDLEGGARPVPPHDDPGLAVQERRDVPGEHPDLDVAALQRRVQMGVALPVQETVDLRTAFAPPLAQSRLEDGLRRPDVARVEIGIADDPALVDRAE